MRVINRCQGVKFMLPAFLTAAFLLAGCAGHNREVAREDLIRARSIIEAAGIAGVDSLAPMEMLEARQDLARAESLLNQEPQTGQLSGNISGRTQLNRLSSERSRQAIAGVSQALQALKEQTGEPDSDIGPEAEAKRLEMKTELAAEQSLESQMNQQSLAAAAADLRSCKNQERLATARLENVRQSMATGPASLSSALSAEFAAELGGWGAEIDPETLVVRFIAPDTAFKNASTWVNRPLRRILEDFFPRLLKVVTKPEYKNRIEEIKVVGFASRVYRGAGNENERHRLNMQLSQERAANVVSFLLQQPTLQDNWLRSHMVAAGLAEQLPVLTAAGVEDLQLSRRIEIRIIMAGHMGG